MWTGPRVSPCNLSTTDRPLTGPCVRSEVACGETPLAARPPAPGRWRRRMNLKEFSAEPTSQRVHPNTGTTGGVGPGTSHPPGMSGPGRFGPGAGRPVGAGERPTTNE